MFPSLLAWHCSQRCFSVTFPPTRSLITTVACLLQRSHFTCMVNVPFQSRLPIVFLHSPPVNYSGLYIRQTMRRIFRGVPLRGRRVLRKQAAAGGNHIHLRPPRVLAW